LLLRRSIWEQEYDLAEALTINWVREGEASPPASERLLLILSAAGGLPTAGLRDERQHRLQTRSLRLAPRLRAALPESAGQIMPLEKKTARRYIRGGPL
jgi:hypothetical protein